MPSKLHVGWPSVVSRAHPVEIIVKPIGNRLNWGLTFRCPDHTCMGICPRSTQSVMVLVESMYVISPYGEIKFASQIQCANNEIGIDDVFCKRNPEG